jgi:hypothetical protein
MGANNCRSIIHCIGAPYLTESKVKSVTAKHLS